MTDLTQCNMCKWKYPTILVNSLRTNVTDALGISITTKAICGICALEITNYIHRINLKKFDGEIAEDMRQNAIKWRKDHPYDDPQKRTNVQPKIMD